MNSLSDNEKFLEKSLMYSRNIRGPSTVELTDLEEQFWPRIAKRGTLIKYQLDIGLPAIQSLGLEGFFPSMALFSFMLFVIRF